MISSLLHKKPPARPSWPEQGGGWNPGPRRWLRLLLLLAVAIVAGSLIRRWTAVPATPDAGPDRRQATPEAPPEPPNPWRTLQFPTAQTGWRDPARPGMFQPTASGRPESALFGSVRTGDRGGSLVATFHEGLDIAALARDKAGRPLDVVVAATAGTVAYANRLAGNSNYGLYVVLTHADPLGPAYTLYAHLAQILPGIAPGVTVTSGAPLGVMGHSSSSAIPVERAHLHFEVGQILNARFAAWAQQQKIKQPHGNYSGWNLLGLNPLDFLSNQDQYSEFTMQSHLAVTPVAFELAIKTGRVPDYFRRYPALWAGAPFAGRALVAAFSESGVPLTGRNATAEESARLKAARACVLRADPAILGRNGARLVRQRNSGWEVAPEGDKLLSMLLF